MDGDRLSGLLLFLLGSYISYEALKLPVGGLRQPDSGFFPLGIGLSLLCLSGLILLGTLRPGRVRAPLQFGEGMGRIVVVIVAQVLYVVVLNRLGYLMATFLIMMLLLKGVERLKWGTTLGVALPAGAVSYVMFRWLGVPLPQGIIPL